MAKNIVLCFDGTGDWAGSDRTNVLQIFEALDLTDPDKQIAYYDGGVGTLVDSTKLTQASKLWSTALDLGLGTSLRDKVLGGYDFLVQNYEAGDEIYLFGFSRGAYTARVLAGVVKVFGLLKKDQANLAPYIWQTYARFRADQDYDVAAERIRKDFSRRTGGGQFDQVQIKFVGLFDTVSSIGVSSAS